MSTVAQVDGLAGALLRCIDEPDRIPLIQSLLDRYCHRLRNRLNSMKLSLYLARRLSEDVAGPEWLRADAAYRAMETMVEQLQVFCSPLQPALAEGDVTHWLEQRLPAWRATLALRTIALEADSPGLPMPGRLDWNRLAQGLDALVALWAGQGTPGGTIRLRWGRDGEHSYVRFEGDDRLGRFGRETESLTLPVLARVLRAHRGTIVIPPDATAVEFRWPAERI